MAVECRFANTTWADARLPWPTGKGCPLSEIGLPLGHAQEGNVQMDSHR